jgi:hypothetical protein
MASRVSSGRWLFRDLRSAFALLGCAAVVVILSIFLFPRGSRSPGERAAQSQAQGLQANLNRYGLDQRYAGAIITSSMKDDKCRELIFDNRKRTMWDVGAISCVSVLPKVEDSHALMSNAERFEEVGKAFRHEGN